MTGRQFATVTRYVVTKLDRNGDRVLFDVMQGRYTYATPEEAQARCDTFRGPGNNLTSVGIDPGTLEVRPCECYAGHFDPCGMYFDVPADLGD